MTIQTLALVAGTLLSLIFSYAPGAKDWYEPLPKTQKRIIMLMLLAIATAGLLVYNCRGDGACYTVSAEPYITTFLLALVANQGAYLISPEPTS